MAYTGKLSSQNVLFMYNKIVQNTNLFIYLFLNI